MDLIDLRNNLITQPHFNAIDILLQLFQRGSTDNIATDKSLLIDEG